MQRLNVCGLTRPTPILRLRRALCGLDAGEQLELTGDDPALVEDVPAFCAQAGHALIMAREGEDGRMVFEIARGTGIVDESTVTASQGETA